jgi:signal transduction histidine kinase
VDRAAYRILQESLTNVLRHAHAGRVTVTVRYQPAAVVIEVTDDGRGSAEQGIGQPGHGIAGMTERAAALRGSLQAGRTSDGGFRTLAVLPTDAAAP